MIEKIKLIMNIILDGEHYKALSLENEAFRQEIVKLEIVYLLRIKESINLKV